MNTSIKICLIGTGIMADIYAKIIDQRPDAELIAVAGNTEESTKLFSSKYNIKGYIKSNYHSMYEENSDVDATIIATPEWVRIAPVSAAIKYNQHILLEKPFAANFDEALELHELLYKYDKVFEICHVLRFSPRFSAMYNCIANGDIGSIRHIYARRHSNNVRVKRVLGKTNLAFWLTPHDIDVMRWITGSEVHEVFARSRCALDSTDDYLIANLRFDNGVDAVLENSWCSPPLSNAAGGARFEVWGTNGSIQIDDSEMNIKLFRFGERLTAPDTYEDFTIYGIHHGIFENLIVRFLESIKLGRSNPDGLRDGIQSIAVCNMISTSIRQNRMVTNEN